MVQRAEWNESIFSSDALDESELVMHYTSVERASAIALTRSLVLSPLHVLNDPRESQQRQSVRVTYGIGGGTAMPDIDDEVASQHDSALWALRDQIRVGCFTADAREGARGSGRDADARGFARARMWAQYGAGHAGCCLILDRLALEAAGAELAATTHCQRVDYVVGVDLLLHEAELVELNDPVTGRTGPDLGNQQRAGIKALFSKNADWATEREFRIVVEDWREDGPCELPIEGVVRGLAFGTSLAEHHLPLVSAMTNAFEVTALDVAVMTVNAGVLSPVPVFGNDGRPHVWSDAQLRDYCAIFDE